MSRARSSRPRNELCALAARPSPAVGAASALHRFPAMIRGTLKVLVVLAATLGLILIIAADPSTVRLESARPVETPTFVDYIAKVTGSPSTSGDRYTVLVNGDQMFPAMLGAIRGAKDRVNFFTYVYEPGQAADQFGAAFAEAARRGVRVTIVVDAFGASSLPADYARRLEDAGCVVEQFRPFRWYSLQETNYRNHRKILVVDGETGFIGGAGIADHWLGDAEDPEHWRDTQIRVDGPAVAYLESAFYEALAETSRRVTPELGTPGAARDAAGASPAGDAQSVIVPSSPGGRSGSVKRLFLLSIAAARRTIDITSPYFIVDGSSQWALDEARRRGVRIRLLVEGDETDAKPVKWASRWDYEGLLRQGVEIHEYQPTMMHAKTLVVDGLWSIVGSANFDNRSLDMNDELSVGVLDPELAATLTTSRTICAGRDACRSTSGGGGPFTRKRTSGSGASSASSSESRSGTRFRAGGAQCRRAETHLPVLDEGRRAAVHDRLEPGQFGRRQSVQLLPDSGRVLHEHLPVLAARRAFDRHRAPVDCEGVKTRVIQERAQRVRAREPERSRRAGIGG